MKVQIIAGNITRNYSSLTEDQVSNATFCSAEYSKASSSQRAKAQASYKVFSGGVEGSTAQIEERQKNVCEGRFGRSYLEAKGIASSELVSDAAVAAVTKCDENRRSFHISDLVAQGDAFTAAMTWSGAGSVTVNNLSISTGPSGAPVARCALAAGGKANRKAPFNVGPAEPVTLTCDRTSYEMAVGAGELVKVLPEGIVTVSTNRDAAIVPLVAVNATRAAPARVTALEGQVATLQAQLAAVAARSDNHDVQSGTVEMKAVDTRPIGDGSSCPVGVDNVRGDRNGRVNFARPFDTTPEVVAALNIVDTTGSETRLVFVVTKIDRTGFNYQFTTYCHAAVGSATANWMAASR